MAERWQQWMPFHIDRFRGSPDVQAMHPVARIGYLYLLASAWQTDDCSVPSDDLDLASLSGLGDDLWAQYKPRILRKFTCRSDGRMFNEVEFSEWVEAKRVFEARSAAARKTNEVRSPRENPTVTVSKNTQSARSPSRSADTITGTGTETTTGTKVQKQPHAAIATCDLPPWIDQEAWFAYDEMRKKIRKPMTPRAQELVLKKLAGFEARGFSSTASLNQSVMSSWTDVYEPKNGGNNAKPTFEDSIAAKKRAINGREERRMADAGDYDGRTLEAGSAPAGGASVGRVADSLFRVS